MLIGSLTSADSEYGLRLMLTPNLSRENAVFPQSKISLRLALLVQSDYPEVKNSYGEWICTHCRHRWQGAIPNAGDDDDVFVPRSTEATEEQQSGKDKRETLIKFLRMCGSKKEPWVTKDYSRFGRQVKKNFLSNSRSIIKTVTSYIAPNDTDEVIHDIFHTKKDTTNCKLDKQFISVMEAISDAYNNAEKWTTRREILSVVAPKINYKLVQPFIPGITKYRSSAVRRHALEFGTGKHIESTPVLRQRFEDYQVEHFIDFILSPHICTDMPFGEQSLKLSDGAELLVPNTIRNLIPSRIIDQYYSYILENSPGFSPLGLNDLTMDINNKRSILDNIKRARMYLKSDYRVHVSKSSTVADHCANFALSCPKDKDYQQKCDHNHDDICDECQNLSTTLERIENEIKSNIENEEFLDRTLAKLNISREAITAFKSHLLRSVNQDLSRQELLENLDDDSIYIFMDFAMKWLSELFMESQESFFGKRGLNDDSDNSSESEEEHNFSTKIYSNKVFVHVMEHCTQDSEVVTAILHDVLKRIKAESPSTQHAFLRSDNAGCYHSAATILSLQQVSKETGIKIERMDFSDPQAGKSICDRYAAIIKANVRRWFNEKHNVTNTREFVEACQSYNGVKEVQAFECKLISNKDKSTFSIPKISTTYNFGFETNGIRLHRAWKVGAGKFILWKNLKCANVISHLLCVDSGSRPHVLSTMTNTGIKSKESTASYTTTTTAEIRHDISSTSSKLYECPEEGCVAPFIKNDYLINHITSGKHRRKVERISMKDQGMQLYHSKLETIGDRRMISLMLESTSATKYQTNIVRLPRGWALPKERIVTRLNPAQTRYLTKKFFDGLKNKMGWKPEEVATEMQQKKDQMESFILHPRNF
ncbi:unnamed protein product [Didymodactylos carnosus]|uniref:C2H2-type domain-containing protein n=1 Tax=Didymodactylos carnosus TaxID=1234261 RepID=A0A8S2E5Q8_9BILA|nr:unnamed protein product [Didymodactylos carnosus]CAF3892219.1 unnamed protein product [Didymodactylos carnosus]